jgi:hypothetical protein
MVQPDHFSQPFSRDAMTCRTQHRGGGGSVSLRPPLRRRRGVLDTSLATAGSPLADLEFNTSKRCRQECKSQ